MAKDRKDNKIGMSYLQRVKLWGVLALLTLSGSSYSTPKKREYGLEDWVDVPGLDRVPRDLYDKGIANLEKGLASTILNIYWLSRDYDQYRQVAKEDVPLQTQIDVGWGGAMKASVDPNKPTYSKYNIWRTPNESRRFFAAQIQEQLTKISPQQYDRLNKDLQAVVEHAMVIVVRESSDGTVSLGRNRPY